MEQVVSPELSQPITTLPASSLVPDEIDAAFATSTIDLISAPLNPRILHITDEFFAPASNLLTPTPPISRPGVFVETGAWYDGWETRRHNPAESDSVIIRLGPAAGRAAGVEIDTAFFTGNHAPEVSVEGAYEPDSDSGDERVLREEYPWQEILGRRACEPSRRHAWRVGPGQEGAYEGEKVTHVRLRIFSDGGVARFRLYGHAVPVWAGAGAASGVGAGAGAGAGEEEVLELSAATNGGIATASSDQHYGKAANLLLPGRGKDMGDGWETKRSRAAGHVDWAVVRLGARGKVRRVVVDTMHFRGNFPREVRISLGDFPAKAGEGEADGMGRMRVASGDSRWVEVASRDEMKPDTEFEFVEGKNLRDVEERAWTHAKLTMIPDGGVKRFRIFGTRA
ncbi:MAG: Allantoicase [Stictis urceolatum]|nr:Allantoicase [Stictis urceolata]